MANKKKEQDDKRHFQGKARAGALFPVAPSGSEMPADLQKSFPDMHGLSPRNLKYMRTFAEA